MKTGTFAFLGRSVGLMAALFVTSARAEVDFLKEVRPILSGHCFKCHGPDAGARKSNLRLDIREETLKPAKSGKIAIVPKQVDESELVKRLFTTDEDDVMPPPSTKNPLTTAEKEILKKWVAEGADYKPHWAFVKPKDGPLPTVKDAGWPRNEIDYFVLARLEQEKLKPSARADKYALVRRLYLDLTGLPPTVAQADAFVNDNSPEAYERLVDTLLASPHYGERWARRWLDLARYADTNGYEKDRPRSMWPYRDWVIKAINADMPFDEFTVEQLAGDMLPKATAEQIIATGFHRNTMLNEEGGVDPLEYRFYSMVDRVHVTSTTWLGMTMACAQCHTHKYDPIQHTDYYAFMALMNNADELPMDVQKEDIRKKRELLMEQIAQKEATMLDRFPLERKIEWMTPAGFEFKSQAGADGEVLVDGSIRVTGKNPDKDTYTVSFDAGGRAITHLLLEAIPDEKVGQGGPGRTDHGNFVLTEIELEAKETGAAGGRKMKFARAEADIAQDGFPVENAIDGKFEGGWAIAANANVRTHRRAVLTLKEPMQLGKETHFTAKLTQTYGGRHTLGRFRLSLGKEISGGEPTEEQRKNLIETKLAKWVQAELPKVVNWKVIRPAEATSGTPVLTIQNDDSVFASGDFTKSDTYTLKFKSLPAGTKAIRLEVLPDDRLPARGPGRVHYEGPEGDFYLSNLKASAGGKPVTFKGATESFASGGNKAATAIDNDLQSGWSISGGQGRAHNAVFELSEPLKEGGDLQIEMTFERYFAAALGRFRVWTTTEDNAMASGLSNESMNALVELKAKKKEKNLVLSAAEKEVLLKDFVRGIPELAVERRDVEKLRSELPKYPTTLVMHERGAGSQRATFRHHRGEFLQPKEKVEPGVPAFLPPLPSGQPANRLTLARWLVSKENPLTGRVMMNRQWEAFFGRGLVRTMEDFGFQGELPTHPALLDWLALEFPKREWSMKQMHKLIVMSATYQQSSVVTPELVERDPLNVLYARGPRFRLEAELVRDSALVASGLFSEKMGGPSVFPPQPPGVSTEGAYGPFQWKVSDGPDRYRRGLYTFAKRTAPYAMTAAFDGPSGEACLARRDRSNTPLQALTLLNDEVFMECARALGQWAADQEGSVESKVEKIFRRCLTRPPTSAEKEKLIKFYERQASRFQKGELKPGELLKNNDAKMLPEKAAWTSLARILLNLDETITKA